MKTVFQFISRTQAFWARRSTPGKLGIGLVLLVLYATAHGLLINAGLIKPEPVRPQTTEASAPTASKDPEPIAMVRPYLRAHLNDWDSYDSQGYSEPEAIAPRNGMRAWRVRHTYRAKNGFNATVLNDQMFYYTVDGVYLVLDAR